MLMRMTLFQVQNLNSPTNIFNSLPRCQPHYCHRSTREPLTPTYYFPHLMKQVVWFVFLLCRCDLTFQPSTVFFVFVMQGHKFYPVFVCLSISCQVKMSVTLIMKYGIFNKPLPARASHGHISCFIKFPGSFC